MHPLIALWTGVICGLALAVPLGAVGVLLIQEGAVRGRRAGAGAAAAVATVDTCYCLAAVAAGAMLAPVITAWGMWPQAIGGALLLAIGVRGIVLAGRASAAGDAGAASRGAPSWRRFAVFFALTAVNPATLLFFAAIVAGLTGIASTPSTAALFVLGVAAASLGWQLLLVLAGAVLHRRAGARSRRLTVVIGNAIVGAIGLLMIVRVVG